MPKSTQIRGPRMFGPRAGLLITGLSLITGLIVGIASGVMGANGVPPVTVAIIVAAVGVVVVMSLAIWWWRQVDEAAREAHKWAWWWGGSLGMGVSGLGLMVLISLGAADTTLAHLDRTALLIFAFATIVGAQLIGYTLAWAGWWLSKR